MSWNKTAPNCLFVFISQLINLILDDIYWFCHLLDFMVGGGLELGMDTSVWLFSFHRFDDGGLIQDFMCVLNCEIKLCCVSTLCWPLLIKKHTVILILCTVKMVSKSKVQVWPVYELLKTCVIASCLFVRVYNCDFEIKSIKKTQRMSNFWFYG